MAAPGRNVRDEVTGPLTDAVFAGAGILRKALRGGLTFEFRYASRIAREFVLSDPEVPDHVWEPQTTKLLLHLAGGARNVVIGGAYFGDHAVLIADRLRGRGRVHAFEPNPENAALLRRNAAGNGLDNLLVREAGLWDEDGARLRLDGDDALAASVPSAAGGFPAATADSHLRGCGVSEIELLMIDVEGAEFRVLRGARNQLALAADRAPALVFEVHRHYVDWTNGLHNTAIVGFLREFGYHVFAVRDYQGNLDMGDRPVELLPPEHTYLEGPPHGFNMLAVKDRGRLEHPLFRFCRGVSPKLLPHKDPSLHHPFGGWPVPEASRK